MSVASYLLRCYERFLSTKKKSAIFARAKKYLRQDVRLISTVRSRHVSTPLDSLAVEEPAYVEDAIERVTSICGLASQRLTSVSSGAPIDRPVAVCHMFGSRRSPTSCKVSPRCAQDSKAGPSGVQYDGYGVAVRGHVDRHHFSQNRIRGLRSTDAVSAVLILPQG